MGLIKGVLKVVGSAALTVTGIASGVGEAILGAAGSEELSELFAKGKEASFNGIKTMWTDPEKETSGEDGQSKIDEFSDNVGTATRRKMAETAKQMAETAKKNGDMEKYEKYMEQYYKYL